LKTYALYIHDDRYSVSTLDLVTASDDECVARIGMRRLAASPHHRSVEIWDDDRLVGRFDRPDSDQPTD
jgi:hypothetical protein